MCNCWQSASKNFSFFFFTVLCNLSAFFFQTTTRIPNVVLHRRGNTVGTAHCNSSSSICSRLGPRSVKAADESWFQFTRSRGTKPASTPLFPVDHSPLPRSRWASWKPCVLVCVCDSDSSRLRDDSQCSPGSWSCRPTPRPPPGAGRWPRASRPPLCAAPSRPCTQSFQ